MTYRDDLVAAQARAAAAERRAAVLEQRLARELGQDPVVVQRMRTAGLLHDIGKVAIPQSLLNKPGRLTSEEFTKLMTHPVVGWEICKPLRTAQSVLDCILYHHERFDGCGYPEGLSGEAIPYQARLLAVADALDALTSERAYRRSLSVDDRASCKLDCEQEALPVPGAPAAEVLAQFPDFVDGDEGEVAMN